MSNATQRPARTHRRVPAAKADIDRLRDRMVHRGEASSAEMAEKLIVITFGPEPDAEAVYDALRW